MEDRHWPELMEWRTSLLDESSLKKITKNKSIKIGRNDPCHCGSGKKHKKCCLPTFH